MGNKNTSLDIMEILKSEKKALLSGDVEALDKIASKKTDWLEANPAKDIIFSNHEMTAIRDLSKENHALFEATLSAQKSVLRRLEDIQKAQKTLGTYSEDGHFQKTDETELELRS